MNISSQLLQDIYLGIQNDNAPIYSARIVQDFKLQNSKNSVVCPAQSTDLNKFWKCMA